MASMKFFTFTIVVAISASSIDVSFAARHLLQTSLPQPKLPPQIPTIPNMPTIPNFPQPTTQQPSLPKPGVLPPLPTMPSLPKVALPPLPKMPSIPNLPTTIPSITSLSPPPSN